MIEKILRKENENFANITPYNLKETTLVVFDLTAANTVLSSLDLNDEHAFNNFIFETLNQQDVKVGIGRYNEDRIIYKRSDVFGTDRDEPRSIHLGIDLWATAGTSLYAPLAGEVHSFKNNKSHGDYGPTIVLTHELEGVVFHTLYGHLSTASLNGLYEGKSIAKGESFAAIGDYHENVHWPPHLHFQIIKDMEGRKGDFPGVAKPSEKDEFLSNCPDPNLILGIERL